MLRRTLTICLVVMTVVGPHLCCCSFAPLFAREAPRSARPVATPTCCTHHAPPAPSGEQEPAGHKHGPSKECPCQQDQPDALKATPELPELARAALPLFTPSRASSGNS